MSTWRHWRCEVRSVSWLWPWPCCSRCKALLLLSSYLLSAIVREILMRGAMVGLVARWSCCGTLSARCSALLLPALLSSLALYAPSSEVDVYTSRRRPRAAVVSACLIGGRRAVAWHGVTDARRASYSPIYKPMIIDRPRVSSCICSAVWRP